MDKDFSELSDKIRDLEEISDKFNALASEVESDIQDQKNTLQSKLQAVSSAQSDFIADDEELDAFIEKPYTVLPKNENESWVIVPRFVSFNVGWLEKQTESYNHFIINKYVNWIEEIPDELKSHVGISKEFENATVENNTLTVTDTDEREKAWDILGGREGGLYKRDGEDKIQIKSGSEFDVIAELIDNGNLPFSKTPVDETDLLEEPDNIELKQHQKRAWNKFLQTGMIGVYWPPSVGKTFLSLYAGERIAGDKLVIVPRKTLEEQWNNRISEFCSDSSDWTVKTYQYMSRKDNVQQYDTTELSLTIFDECHTLPATTYSKISTIDTKYRIGLSATPYREEEGTTKYIFALTGHPVGLNWQEMMELGVTKYPDVKVILHRTERQKNKSVTEYAAEKTGKMIIFCDSIAKGKSLSAELDVPFIHGETTDRIEKFKSNRIVISSRVGDEGLSISDIDTVIEYDFHGRSRRQELQRAGRVMHNKDTNGEHIVLMTDDEYDKYNDRFLSLEQKGFNIQKIRAY